MGSTLKNVRDALDDLSGGAEVLAVVPSLCKSGHGQLVTELSLLTVDLVPAVEDVGDGAGGQLGLGWLESPHPGRDRVSKEITDWLRVLKDVTTSDSLSAQAVT